MSQQSVASTVPWGQCLQHVPIHPVLLVAIATRSAVHEQGTSPTTGGLRVAMNTGRDGKERQ